MEVSNGSIDEEEKIEEEEHVEGDALIEFVFIAESTQTRGYPQPFEMNITIMILPPVLKLAPVIEKQQLNSIPRLCEANCTNQQILDALNTYNDNYTSGYEIHGMFIGKGLTSMRRSIADVSLNAENALKLYISNMESRGYTFRHRTNGQTDKTKGSRYSSPMIG